MDQQGVLTAVVVFHGWRVCLSQTRAKQIRLAMVNAEPQTRVERWAQSVPSSNTSSMWRHAQCAGGWLSLPERGSCLSQIGSSNRGVLSICVQSTLPGEALSLVLPHCCICTTCVDMSDRPQKSPTARQIQRGLPADHHHYCGLLGRYPEAHRAQAMRVAEERHELQVQLRLQKASALQRGHVM